MRKCPFPGMDPFIEAHEWPDFHLMLTSEIKRQLIPQLPEHYQLTAELSVKQSGDEAAEPNLDDLSSYRPDIGILETSPGASFEGDGGGGVAVATPTRELVSAPRPKQRELRIRDTRDNRLVTVMEVLSPSNKRGDGWVKHRRKVEAYEASLVNVLDIDLLRGGHYSFGLGGSELYTPEEDGHREAYCIALYMPGGRIKVWDIGLLDVLPPVPVPLRYPDGPVVLDLQRAFTEVYTYSTYSKRSVDQIDAVRPPLNEEEREALAKYLVVA